MKPSYCYRLGSHTEVQKNSEKLCLSSYIKFSFFHWFVILQVGGFGFVVGVLHHKFRCNIRLTPLHPVFLWKRNPEGAIKYLRFKKVQSCRTLEGGWVLWEMYCCSLLNSLPYIHSFSCCWRQDTGLEGPLTRPITNIYLLLWSFEVRDFIVLLLPDSKQFVACQAPFLPTDFLPGLIKIFQDQIVVWKQIWQLLIESRLEIQNTG